MAWAIFLSQLLACAAPFSLGPVPPGDSGLALQALSKLAPRLTPQALETALTALKRLQTNGAKVRSDVLTVIDYTKPSTERRLWVFDLIQKRVLFEELVAHGKNSGDNQAETFSNAPESLMTSLGVFLTGGAYIGRHGLSLRLEGLEKGINDNAMSRAIVIHGANYVSDAIAKAKGRIGRSWGCPAVRSEIASRLIKILQDGSLVIAYYPDRSWLQASKLCCSCARCIRGSRTIRATRTRSAESEAATVLDHS
jgi:hypothetical protein